MLFTFSYIVLYGHDCKKNIATHRVRRVAPIASRIEKNLLCPTSLMRSAEGVLGCDRYVTCDQSSRNQLQVKQYIQCDRLTPASDFWHHAGSFFLEIYTMLVSDEAIVRFQRNLCGTPSQPFFLHRSTSSAQSSEHSRVVGADDVSEGRSVPADRAAS